MAFTDKNFWTTLFNRRMLVCLFTGFSSGLPLYILFQQIPAWMRVEGIDVKTIGLFALVQLPYTWKFVWAPIMDRYSIPVLGRRRGWMLVTQLALTVLIASLALVDPSEGLILLLCLAGGIAFFSASQDIVLDAYRREILSDEELGAGNSYATNAYKISSLVPGALALILADQMPWSTVNLIVASFMLIGVVTTLVCDEPEHTAKGPERLIDAIVNPFIEFFSKSRKFSKALAILLFMMLYKLGDNMAVALESVFFLDMGYSLTEIGSIAKACKLWAGVVGSFIGGAVMIKIGINRALWVFGVAQICSILGYMGLASLEGQDTFVLFGISMSMLIPLGAALILEYLGVGLGMVALVAFMARLCNTEFTATQFALLSSLAAVPRTMVSASTGYLVDWLGYEIFFVLCYACAIPGMLMLFIVAPWNEDKQVEEPVDS